MLENIKNLMELNGKTIIHMANLREQYPDQVHANGQMKSDFFEKNIRPNMDIIVREDTNSITFDMSKCKPSDLMEMAHKMCVGELNEHVNEKVSDAIYDVHLMEIGQYYIKR